MDAQVNKQRGSKKWNIRVINFVKKKKKGVI